MNGNEAGVAVLCTVEFFNGSYGLARKSGTNERIYFHRKKGRKVKEDRDGYLFSEEERNGQIPGEGDIIIIIVSRRRVKEGQHPEAHRWGVPCGNVRPATIMRQRPYFH